MKASNRRVAIDIINVPHHWCITYLYLSNIPFHSAIYLLLLPFIPLLRVYFFVAPTFLFYSFLLLWLFFGEKDCIRCVFVKGRCEIYYFKVTDGGMIRSIKQTSKYIFFKNSLIFSLFDGCRSKEESILLKMKCYSQSKAFAEWIWWRANMRLISSKSMLNQNSNPLQEKTDVIHSEVNRLQVNWSFDIDLIRGYEGDNKLKFQQVVGDFFLQIVISSFDSYFLVVSSSTFYFLVAVLHRNSTFLLCSIDIRLTYYRFLTQFLLVCCVLNKILLICCFFIETLLSCSFSIQILLSCSSSNSIPLFCSNSTFLFFLNPSSTITFSSPSKEPF